MPLLLLCGIPGAGKTTLAKQLSTTFEAKHFSFDKFIESQLGPSTSSSNYIKDADAAEPSMDEDLLKPMKIYRKLWENSIINHLNQILENSDLKNPLIILDDNFYLQSQRRGFAKLGKRYGLKICCVKILVDVGKAQRRNDKRNCAKNERILEILKVDSETIKKMDERFENSGIDYFHDPIVSNISDLITFIQTFLNQHPDNFSLPTTATSASPSPLEQSAFQELDSLTRKIASKIISSGYQQYGNEINDIRREFMEQIKSNSLDLNLNLDIVDCEENKIFIQNFLFDKIEKLGIIK